jgi:hypothetical protein
MFNKNSIVPALIILTIAGVSTVLLAGTAALKQLAASNADSAVQQIVPQIGSLGMAERLTATHIDSVGMRHPYISCYGDSSAQFCEATADLGANRVLLKYSCKSDGSQHSCELVHSTH